MELICLNTWGARAGVGDLLAFFERYKHVDVFCLQEVWNGGEHALDATAAGRSMQGVATDLFRKISVTLSEHSSYFRPHYYDFFGLAVFIKKNIPIVKEGEIPIYKEPGYISAHDIADHARILQYVTFETGQGLRTIMNVHAAWQPGGKSDTPERLLQTDKITSFLRTIDHPFILCGDFNLLPETRSVHGLELAGLRNLVIDFGISSTRTSLYTKDDQFADYIFTSRGIEVDDFQVPSEEVSDHRALYLRSH